MIRLISVIMPAAGVADKPLQRLQGLARNKNHERYYLEYSMVGLAEYIDI